MSESNELPKGWAKARVDSLVQLVNGFAFKPTQWKSEGLPIIRIQNLNNNDAPFNYCPEDLPDKIRVRNGDLLFAWSGTPGTSFGAHIWRGQDAWLNQHIFKVNFNREYLDERYLRLAINQNLDSYIRQAHGGAGLAHITKGRFEESRLPIAPLNEQSRIVAKIEELFSDLDAGVAALKRAKANLKRYRASVLKAAVEGKLTAQWRAKHPATEPASALLARILKERRLKWEADQFAKFAAAKKEPPKNWRDKYVEPTPPDTECVPELPEGWTVATVDQLMATITSGSRDWTQYYGSGTGTFIMAQNVRKGLLDLAYRQEVNPPPYDRDRIRSQVVCNDLLVTIVGANTGDVCRVAIELPEHYVCQSVSLMRPVVASVAKYLEAYFIADHGGQKYFRGYIYGQGRPHLGFDDLRNTPVVLPPLHEQGQMIAEVEQHLSIIDAAERQIEHGLLRAARLRQSILKRAFKGKLVPQDPKDEPASALLERMRASRSVHEGNSKPVTQPRVRRAKHQPNGEAS